MQGRERGSECGEPEPHWRRTKACVLTKMSETMGAHGTNGIQPLQRRQEDPNATRSIVDARA